MYSKRLKSMGYDKKTEEMEYIEAPVKRKKKDPVESMKERKKGVTYIFSLILLSMVGMGLLVTGLANKTLELGLDKGLAMTLGFAGVLCLIGMILVLWFYLNFLMLQEDKWEIEENDERNIMIRGMTAKYGKLIFPVVMLVVELILLLNNNTDAGVLVAIGVAVATVADLLLFAFFQKKY